MMRSSRRIRIPRPTMPQRKVLRFEWQFDAFRARRGLLAAGSFSGRPALAAATRDGAAVRSVAHSARYLLVYAHRARRERWPVRRHQNQLVEFLGRLEPSSSMVRLDPTPRAARQHQNLRDGAAVGGGRHSAWALGSWVCV